MADELRGIENGLNLLYGRLPEPLPSDSIRPEQNYQMQIDPILQQSLDGPPAGPSSYEQQLASGQDPFAVQGMSLGRSPMAGWHQSTDQGGLGLAGRGPAPERQESLDEHFARQLFPTFKGELTFGDKLRLRSGLMDAIPQMASRREQIAQQAAQLEEQKQQHMFQQVATIDKEFANEPEKWQAQMQHQVAAGNPFAQTMLQAGSKQMAGDFEAVASTFQQLYPDLAVQYRKNPSSISPATMKLALKASHDYSVETRKATIDETAKQDRVQGILTRFKQNPDDLSDTELDIVDKFYKAQDERKVKQEELKRRVQNLGLEGQHKRQEIARGKAPIVSPGYITPGGETEHIITDPATGQRKTVSGVPMNRTQTQDLDPKFTPEQAARVSAMNMTLNNVSDLRDKLVPDGKTVDRRVLFSSMFGGLPFTEGRDVERFIEDAIETKLRLQTGAAANKDEVKKEAAKFKPNQLDSDDTIVGKFDKLERYMQDTFNVLDPSGVVRARLGSAGSNIGAPPIPFDTAYEDLKKKRPNWNQKEIFRELQRRGVKPE